MPTTRNIAKEFHQFSEKIGVVSSFECFGLGIPADDFFGSFGKKRLHELKSFCNRNPGHHIVSLTDDLEYVNFLDESCYLFMLADGDDNPALRIRSPAFYSWRCFYANDLP